MIDLKCYNCKKELKLDYHYCPYCGCKTDFNENPDIYVGFTKHIYKKPIIISEDKK